MKRELGFSLAIIGLVFGVLLSAWALAGLLGTRDEPERPPASEPSMTCYGPVLAFTDGDGTVTATAVLGTKGCAAVLAAPIADGGEG